MEDEDDIMTMADPMVGRSQTVAQLALILDQVKSKEGKAAVIKSMEILNHSMAAAMSPIITTNSGSNVIEVGFLPRRDLD